ncbi:6-carboxytetrahydropterin synthase [Kitasatospora sp. NPDC085879]|uniref:6-carboxytetrahydropterin synthase n=1 Tax=Kitasatospora sp. NPDC085879 TaxID=3154769 RepID=UPI000BB1167A|nr:6-carboxytetrahydropterin synthase [Streptomyces sp. TLI_235]PBC69746.1 6-pyruvoyltetrahydropterin/6-carboxytetrahydropterin synthase [Streptomyces sp. TLI_235]
MPNPESLLRPSPQAGTCSREPRLVGTYTIGKLVGFDAARTVRGVDESGLITAELLLTARELSGAGFVTDFGDLAAFRTHIDTALDHRDLDQVLADTSDQGIAEHLHAWAAANLPDGARDRLHMIRVLTGRLQRADDAHSVQFSARHWLDGLPDGHKCGREHGHAYLVTLSSGPGGDRLLPVPGELRDLLASGFEGKVLNRVVGVNPTSEHLAAYLAGWLASRGLADAQGRSFAVRVSETESTWAEFTPDALVPA